MKSTNKKVQLIHKEPDSECMEILKSAIVNDKVLKKYKIDENTLIQNLPENVLNNFLEYLAGFELHSQEVLLELIKKGEIGLECSDD